MKTKPLHLFLVGTQFFALIFAAMAGKVLSSNWLIYAIYALAMLLAVSAVYSMKMHTLTALPTPKLGSILCQSGPYKLMRHPMYSSLLMIMSAFLLTDFNWIRVVAAFVLSAVIFAKIKIEEKALLQKFDDYSVYMKKTGAIVPYIY